MASRGVNKVILVGNLGADPETRFMPSGGSVTNVRLATSETWKDKQTGQPQERTEWHRVVFFNKLAEIAGEYLRKGSKVYVEGSIRTRKWQDQSGQDRYTTEVVGNEMQMLDSRGSGGMGGDSAGGGGYDYPEASQPQAGGGKDGSGSMSSGQGGGSGSPASASQDPYDDDIPYMEGGHVVMPYAFDTNDMRFSPGGGFVQARDFSDYVIAAFDRLHAERAGAARMLSRSSIAITASERAYS